MPLIVLASAKGAPGVTTTALALGAAWPAPNPVWAPGSAPVVVEADPSGGDAAAWYRVPDEPGLAGLAAAVRTPRGADATMEVARSYARSLGGAWVVTAPVGAGQTRTALSILAAAGGPLAVAGMASVPLLVDVGRLSPASPVVPLLAAADLVVLVTRAGLGDLAHVRGLAAELAEVAPRRLVLLRGPSRYPIGEVAAQLGVPLLGRVPDDARMGGGRQDVGRPWWHRPRAVTAVTVIAAQLAKEFGTVPFRDRVPEGGVVTGGQISAVDPRSMLAGVPIGPHGPQALADPRPIPHWLGAQPRGPADTPGTGPTTTTEQRAATTTAAVPGAVSGGPS